MPTVKAIVEDYLRALGYGGLYSDSGECCCSIDGRGGIMYCEEPGTECMAGIKVLCDPNIDPAERIENCDGDCEYHIVPKTKGESGV